MPKAKIPGLAKSAGNTFPVWNEGWYLMTGLEAKEDTSSGGHPQVRLKMIIEDVDENVDENDRDPIGMKFTSFHTFSGQDFQVDQFKEIVNAFGVSVTNADNIELDDFIDAQAWVYLVIDEYNGNKNNKVRNARPVDEE
jgi:hypothetical protein